ncbi:MAG: proline dehydrogenase [Alectoria fallacina]|uniref:Proline dehydrogenase n=1 Tax=Alectoria fallacina TaxID=1903189 RepID=A0A8H3FTA1_9LECA|nr:MAG: proline dehydrogenase [Alectoria fallacina]
MLKSQQSLRILQHASKPPHLILTRCRFLHSDQSQRTISTTASTDPDTYASTPAVTPTLPIISQPSRPLSLLPLPILLRSYALTALSSYPLLLSPSLRLLSLVAHSSSAFLNPDRNPLLHYLLKKTFYAQFCAGETKNEVQKTVKGLKCMGYRGVILAYGKEIVLEKGEKIDTSSSQSADPTAEKDVHDWKEGTLQTVEMAEDGDMIGLKFSGAGRDAMRQLAAETLPSEAIEKATTEICDLAQARGVRLLFDAEQDAVQRGIDAWTLHFARRYNKTTLGKAVVYGTYQAYLRSTPMTLAKHLANAQQEGFTLGVKLVRGAYMGSDPRTLFWETKEDTDKAYNGMTEALLRRQWNGILKPSSGEKGGKIPAEVAFVLASHNHDSVQKAMAIRKEQTESGEVKIDLAYGQLMGMADEVSCELVMAAKARGAVTFEKTECAGPKAYKYLVWGSVGECLKYLIRRAEENRDAVVRAKGTRMALRMELGRRIWG